MTEDREKIIQRLRPEDSNRRSAMDLYKLLTALSESRFPLSPRYKAFLEKCGNAFNIPVAKLASGGKREALKAVKEHDLSRTVLEVPKVVKPLVKSEKPALVWGGKRSEIKLPTIINRNPEIIPLHQDWKITYENMTDEFWAWINSINRGFQHVENYDQFDAYVNQANSWLSDNRSIVQCRTDNEREAFVQREIERWDCNKLYFLNKVWRYQDASSRTGFTIYSATKAAAILAYLFDCRWDLDIAKARQVIFTTTIFGMSVAETLIHPTFFTKIITADLTKAEETFLQKLRLPFADLPAYYRPDPVTVANGVHQGKQHFEIREKGKSSSSLIKIVPPSIDAVNSGSPDLRLIDEQALISILAEMKNEMKSSALKPDSKRGESVRKGQTIGWGSSDAIQFPQFETLHRSNKESWEKKAINSLSSIPLYFNVWARKHFSQKNYDELYQQAYADTSVARQHTITQFHQSFPIDYDDMFISNPATLIDMDIIVKETKRIDEAAGSTKTRANVCEFGYFEPTYDMNNTTTKSADQPYHIVGSQWIKCRDNTDPRVTCCIFRHPPENEVWDGRFFAGTDPTMGVSGHSRFAKTIIDNLDDPQRGIVAGMPVALMASRSTKPEYEYLQSLLLSLHYGREVDELIEVNFGAPYMKWLTDNGYDYLMIPRKSLPSIYQIQSAENYGISKKAGANSRHIINAGWTYLDRYHEHIWIRQYFSELKTYVNTPTTQGTKRGQVITNQFAYGPKDPDVHYDDALDSLFYAAIALEAYGFKSPKNLQDEVQRIEEEWVYIRDSNFNLVRVKREKRAS